MSISKVPDTQYAVWYRKMGGYAWVQPIPVRIIKKTQRKVRIQPLNEQLTGDSTIRGPRNVDPSSIAEKNLDELKVRFLSN